MKSKSCSSKSGKVAIPKQKNVNPSLSEKLELSVRAFRKAEKFLRKELTESEEPDFNQQGRKSISSIITHHWVFFRSSYANNKPDFIRFAKIQSLLAETLWSHSIVENFEKHPSLKRMQHVMKMINDTDIEKLKSIHRNWMDAKDSFYKKFVRESREFEKRKLPNSEAKMSREQPTDYYFSLEPLYAKTAYDSSQVLRDREIFFAYQKFLIDAFPDSIITDQILEKLKKFLINIDFKAMPKENNLKILIYAKIRDQLESIINKLPEENLQILSDIVIWTTLIHKRNNYYESNIGRIAKIMSLVLSRPNEMKLALHAIRKCHEADVKQQHITKKKNFEFLSEKLVDQNILAAALVFLAKRINS